MKTKISLLRRLGAAALALGLLGSAASTALATVDSYLIGLAGLSNAGVTLTFTQIGALFSGGHLTAANSVADINYIMGDIAASDAGGYKDYATAFGAAGEGIIGSTKYGPGGLFSLLNTPILQAEYLPACVAAAVTDSYYVHGGYGANKDVYEALIPEGAIQVMNGTAKTDANVGAIVAQSLATSDQTPTAYAQMVYYALALGYGATGDSTPNNTSLNAVLNAIGQNGTDAAVLNGNSEQNAGVFLENIYKNLGHEDQFAALAEGLFSGLGKTDAADINNASVGVANAIAWVSKSQDYLDTWAWQAAISAAAVTGTNQQAVAAGTGHNLLVGITSQPYPPYSAAALEDIGREGEASNMVYALPSYANALAAGIGNPGTIADSADDLVAYADSILTPVAYSADYADSTNGVVNVTETIANNFPGVANTTAKGNVGQAGLIALNQSPISSSTTGSFATAIQNLSAGIAADVLNNTGDGNYAADVISFGTAFITAVDGGTQALTKISISDAERADVAIGLVTDTNATFVTNTNAIQSPNFVPQVVASAALSDDATALPAWLKGKVGFNFVVQPVFAAINANTLISSASATTLVEQSAAQTVASVTGQTYYAGTYTAAIVAAGLIEGTGATTTAPNIQILDEIVTGVTTDSHSSAYLTGGYTVDHFLTDVAGSQYLYVDAYFPYIKEVVTDLITKVPGNPFSDTQVVGDLLNTGGAQNASSSLYEASNIAATAAGLEPGDAAKIEYATAFSGGVSSATYEKYIVEYSSTNVAVTAYNLGTDQFALITGTAAPALSAIFDKQTLAQKMAANVPLGSVTADVPALALADGNSLATNDGQLSSDLASISYGALSGLSIGQQTSTNVKLVADDVALNYEGAAGVGGAPQGLLTDAQAAGYAQNVIVYGESYLKISGVPAAVINDLVPAYIHSEGNTVLAGDSVAADWAAAFVNASGLYPAVTGNIANFDTIAQAALGSNLGVAQLNGAQTESVISGELAVVNAQSSGLFKGLGATTSGSLTMVAVQNTQVATSPAVGGDTTEVDVAIAEAADTANVLQSYYQTDALQLVSMAKTPTTGTLPSGGGEFYDETPYVAAAYASNHAFATSGTPFFSFIEFLVGHDPLSAIDVYGYVSAELQGSGVNLSSSISSAGSLGQAVLYGLSVANSADSTDLTKLYSDLSATFHVTVTGLAGANGAYALLGDLLTDVQNNQSNDLTDYITGLTETTAADVYVQGAIVADETPIQQL